MKEKSNSPQMLPICLLMKRVVFAIFLFTIVSFNNVAFGQWKQILTFPGPSEQIHDIVYFLDEFGHPEIGFASFWNATFRTSDGGQTWQQVSTFGQFTDITFKDALTGWTASGMKTTDGGFIWSDMKLLMGPAKAIHYVALTQRLFLSYWEPVSNSDPPASYVSTDEGKTWTQFTQDARLNGYAFVDDMHGIIGTTECSILPTDGVMRTSDGGLIWTYDPAPKGCWQPYAREGTSTFFYLSEYDNGVRRSDDYGATWNIISQLPQYHTGCLKGDLCGNLYVQGSTSAGFTKWLSVSNDNGVSWNDIAGPAISVDTRFYIVGSKVFAQDDDGSLWSYNGPGNGPAGASLLSVPSSITVSSMDCDTQTISIPFQALSCFSGTDSLIAASLTSSASSFSLVSGSIPRQNIGGDSVHIIYKPDHSGQDTATLSLSAFAGGIRIDTNIRIIGNSIRPSKSVALSDTSFLLSSLNCQEVDTLLYLTTFGCPADFDSISGISITGSNEFSIFSPDTIARKFNLRDSLRLKYNPTIPGNDTALVHLQLLVAGQAFDTVVSIYGQSTIPKVNLTPQLVGLDNPQNVSVRPGQDVPLALTLSSNVTSLVGLDSIVFEIDFDSNMLSLDSVVLAPGWKVSTADLYQGKLIYTIVSDSSIIPQEMTLATLHFTAFLTKDTVSLVSLTSFNGFLDPLKHVGCDELSVASGNSATITAEDTCGDIFLRNFMITGSPGFQIFSIQPNPAFDFLAVDCESPSSIEIDAIIYNNLGIECSRMQNNVQGRVTLNLPLNALTPGAYHLLLRSSLGLASTNFIKF